MYVSAQSKKLCIYLSSVCFNMDWSSLHAIVSECDCLVGRNTFNSLLHVYIQVSVFTRCNAQQRPCAYKQKCLSQTEPTDRSAYHKQNLQTEVLITNRTYRQKCLSQTEPTDRSAYHKQNLQTANRSVYHKQRYLSHDIKYSSKNATMVGLKYKKIQQILKKYKFHNL